MIRLLRWTGPARNDLLAVFAYVASRNPAAADRVIERITTSAASLVIYPAKGRDGRVAGTRELVVFGTPYVVAYRLKGEQIAVLRVLHGARRWPRTLP